MAIYMTKQRKILLDFLGEHPHDIFSAVQICENLQKENISLSAVYRNLSELESAGHIRKIIAVGSRERLYQYSKSNMCKDKIHLHCKICNKIEHLDSAVTNEFYKSVLASDGFELNKTETIIYGVCKKCRNTSASINPATQIETLQLKL